MVCARPFFSGSPRLRALQRLHLALLVAAQHQRVLGRFHVQPHDVFKLLSELRIARDLEAAHDVWLQAVGLPMAHDGAGADAQDLTHLARAPVRGRLGCRLRGQLHHLGHIHLHRWCAARQIALDARDPRLKESLAPASHLHAPDCQLLGDLIVLQARGRQQEDLCALRQAHTGAFGARQPRQLGLLLVCQLNRRGELAP